MSKRILMISTHGYVAAKPPLGKPDTGGQVVYVLELSKHLAALGKKVDILTRQFDDQPAEEPVAPGVRILRFPCGGKEFIEKERLCDHLPELIEAAAAYLHAHGLDYEFINSHYWDAGIAGRELSAELQVPHVHTPHSIGSWKRDQMKTGAAKGEALYNFSRRIREERSIYHAADLVIATSKAQKKILRGPDYDTPRGKIRVLTPGYDARRYYPLSSAGRAAAKRRLHIEGPLVFAVGRLAENKGYDLLLAAMPTVVARIPNVQLWLAIGVSGLNKAETERFQRLKQLTADLGIAKNVRFLDHIPDPVLPDYYRAADVFALSSRYEPFGMTAVEAMACGTPTIVTTQGGLWERLVWGRDALYADPRDPEAFGMAILTVLQHPEVARRIGRCGARKALTDFTWMGISQRLLDLVVETTAGVEAEQGAALEYIAS